jgi:hypothetical protein
MAKIFFGMAIVFYVSGVICLCLAVLFPHVEQSCIRGAALSINVAFVAMLLSGFAVLLEKL